jgi:hypothetical protein
VEKESQELKDEAKSAAEARMTAVWEKLMKREESEIENKNLAEGEEEEEITEDIMEVKGEGEQEKGTLIISF